MLDFIVVRAIFVLILGATAAYFRSGEMPLWAAGFAGAAIAAAAIILETRIQRVRLKRLIGIAGGTIAGLVCSALVSVVLGRLGADVADAPLRRRLFACCCLSMSARSPARPKANC